MKNILLLIVFIIIASSCGKSKKNDYYNAIESSHKYVDVERSNLDLDILVNQKVKLRGSFNVASVDSCLMDTDSSACVDIDNNFFSRYNALAGQTMTLYGLLRRQDSGPNQGYALIEVYYYKDTSGEIVKVSNKDY